LEPDEESKQGEGCHSESEPKEEANSEQELEEEDRPNVDQERAQHFDDELETEEEPLQTSTMSPQNDIL